MGLAIFFGGAVAAIFSMDATSVLFIHVAGTGGSTLFVVITKSKQKSKKRTPWENDRYRSVVL